MMSILNQDAPSVCMATGAFVRMSGNGNGDQVTVQFKQVVAQAKNNGGTNNKLLALAQGGSGRSATTLLSTNFSFKREQFMQLIAPAMGITELPEATTETVWVAKELELPAAELLGIDEVNIECTESPYQNPFAPNQTMQQNPSKGTVVIPLDENGDVLIDEATGQEIHGFFRHTELVTEAPVNQFIGQYNEIGRKLGRQTQAQVSKATATPAPLATEVPVSINEKVGA